MTFPRSTGILLHPISLPSRGGIGDLGSAACEFLDFLAEARQGLWQVLPLNPPALSDLPTQVSRIDYEQVNRDKLPLLWQAARNFLERASGDARQRFNQFCEGNSWWLEDCVLFDTLRERHGKNWNLWPVDLA